MKKQERESSTAEATLDDLFQAGANVQDAQLATALIGIITLAEGTDRVFIEQSFSSAGTKKKLVAVSLGRYVLARKGLIKEELIAKSSDWYAAQVQENPKTVTEELSRLKAAGLFDRTDSGYLVPQWALLKAIEYLSKKNNK